MTLHMTCHANSVMNGRNRNSIHARAQDKQHRTLAGKIQDVSHQWMGKLTVISDNVAR